MAGINGFGNNNWNNYNRNNIKKVQVNNNNSLNKAKLNSGSLSFNKSVAGDGFVKSTTNNNKLNPDVVTNSGSGISIWKKLGLVACMAIDAVCTPFGMATGFKDLYKEEVLGEKSTQLLGDPNKSLSAHQKAGDNTPSVNQNIGIINPKNIFKGF